MDTIHGNAVRALAMLVLLFGMAGSGVSAQEAPSPLSMKYVNVTMTRDTARVRAGRTEALPNDTLRYELTFTNREQRPLSNVVFDNPLPNGLVLIGGTATANVPARVEYSIDGGRTFSAQPMVRLIENGREVQRPAAPASYNSIRWTVTGSVLPGASVTARFDAQVGTRPSPAAR